MMETRQETRRTRVGTVSPLIATIAMTLCLGMGSYAHASPLVLELGGGTTMELVQVPAGTFLMGSSRDTDEQPVHNVTISQSYYIGKFEVTQAQWRAVMGTNPSLFKGSDNMPVQEVSPANCRTFCQLLSARTGLTVRLPTEAEWEYACRGGTNTDYHWGNSATDAGQYAWHSGNSGGTPHEVGLKLPNSLGIYDMAGNVKEWCNDWYGSTYYGVSPAIDPTGPVSGTYTCLRGGAWFYGPDACRSANRDWGWNASNLGIVGFRVVAVPEPGAILALGIGAVSLLCRRRR